MSRGPRANQTLADAIVIAKIRGNVQMAEPGPEKQYDFTITGTKPSAFVSVKYTERITMFIEDIARECDEKIQRLRSVAQDTAVSCELWLRSRYGTWRFFRVFAEGMVEIGRDGKELSSKVKRACQGCVGCELENEIIQYQCSRVTNSFQL